MSNYFLNLIKTNVIHYPELQSKDKSKTYNATPPVEEIAAPKKSYINTEDLTAEKNIDIHRIKVNRLYVTSSSTDVAPKARSNNENLLSPHAGPLEELYFDFLRGKPSQHECRKMLDVLKNNYKNLKKLFFRIDFDGQNTEIPDAESNLEIKSIFLEIKNLTKLDTLEIVFINSAFLFDEDAFIHLAESIKALSNIRHLHLNFGHNSIGDDQFYALFRGMRRLEKLRSLSLNISRSMMLNDFGMVPACLGKLTGLETLKINAMEVNAEQGNFPKALDLLTNLTDAYFRLPFFDQKNFELENGAPKGEMEKRVDTIVARRLQKEMREKEETVKQALIKKPE